MTATTGCAEGETSLSGFSALVLPSDDVPQEARAASLLKLPWELLIIILSALGSSHKALASINRACRATHSALPHAICPPTTTTTDDTPTASPAAAAPLFVRLDLDSIGQSAAVPDQAGLAASLTRVAARFAQLPALHLRWHHPAGAHGARLFSAHVAPHLLAVRHLFVDGPRSACMPGMWKAPAAARLAADVRELRVAGHHSSVAPLAARLSTLFPALTDAVLTLDTIYSPSGGHGGHLQGLVVSVPAGLRTLTVSAQILRPSSSSSSSSSSTQRAACAHDSLDPGVLDLHMTGSPHSLHSLTCHTWSLGRNGSRSRPPRPLRLWGRLPGLSHLDITLSADIEEATLPVFNGVAQACPSLTHLVVRGWTLGKPYTSERAWLSRLEQLSPLRATLRHLDLHRSHHLDVYTATRQGMQRVAARALPGTMLTITPRRAHSEPLLALASLGLGVAVPPIVHFNPQMLVGYTLGQQKQLIGEHLFVGITHILPAGAVRLAGKVTGMLLELDVVSLLSLLNSAQALQVKVEEAVALLLTAAVSLEDVELVLCVGA